MNFLKWKKVTKMTKYRYLSGKKFSWYFWKLFSFRNIGLGEQILELTIFDSCNFWTTSFCKDGPNFCHLSAFLHFKSFQNDLSTWSILGKNDPNFAFPNLILHNQRHAILYCVCCGIFSLPYCRYTIVFWLYGKSEIGNIVQFTLSS